MLSGRSAFALEPRVTERRNYLETLEERVGPASPGLQWQSQFKLVLKRNKELGCCVVLPGSGAEADQARSDLENIRFYRYENGGGYVDREIQGMLRNMAWTEHEAETLQLLLPFGGAAIGDAVRNRDSMLAPSCHALANVLASQARKTKQVAPPLYLTMKGVPSLPFGFADMEPGIANLEQPDATGACAVCCSAPRTLFDDPLFVTEAGYHLYDRKSGSYVLCESDIICIRSQGCDDACIRTAVLYSSHEENRYALPPNTLLVLENTEGPPFEARFRRWHTYTHADGTTRYIDRKNVTQAEVDWSSDEPVVSYTASLNKASGKTCFRKNSEVFDDIGYDPNEVFIKVVNRRLLTATVRCMLPMNDPSGSITKTQKAILVAKADSAASGACKFASTVELSYLDRRAYIRGCEDVTQKLAHTMAEEWIRNAEQWSDCKGVTHCGKSAWAYVNGAASIHHQGHIYRDRDMNHEGHTPEDFLLLANNHIKERASMLQRDLHPLSLSEVLAVRLYTGPGYQPLNSWLRRVLQSESAPERRAAALDPSSSFGSTTGHLITALRKLAAASTLEEGRRRVFRGLRGRMQGRFWLPDDQGMTCATDSGFMSCSLQERTPINFMDGDCRPNVLFELEQFEEDDAGFHCGADVSMLSQFAGEMEVIFPPLTMLHVKVKSSGQVFSLKPQKSIEFEQLEGAQELLHVAKEVSKDQPLQENNGKLFHRITVTPTFTG
jgi:hypothetical protein